MINSAALFSETGLLWGKKVVMLDKPGQTVGNDPFEYFAETGCEADGSVGVGIIRRFAGLGEGSNYGFFPRVRDETLLYRALKSRRTLFLLLGERFFIISLWIRLGSVDLLLFFFVACSSLLRVKRRLRSFGELLEI